MLFATHPPSEERRADLQRLAAQEGGRIAAQEYRAQLAPACRDNGIVVFDPLGWTVDRGHIALQARKGHKMQMERDANGVWRRMGGDPKARPLSLRRIN